MTTAEEKLIIAQMQADLGVFRHTVITQPDADARGQVLRINHAAQNACVENILRKHQDHVDRLPGNDAVRQWNATVIEPQGATDKLEDRWSGQGHRVNLGGFIGDDNEHDQLIAKYGEERAIWLQRNGVYGPSNNSNRRPKHKENATPALQQAPFTRSQDARLIQGGNQPGQKTFTTTITPGKKSIKGTQNQNAKSGSHGVSAISVPPTHLGTHLVDYTNSALDPRAVLSSMSTALINTSIGGELESHAKNKKPHRKRRTSDVSASVTSAVSTASSIGLKPSELLAKMRIAIADRASATSVHTPNEILSKPSGDRKIENTKPILTPSASANASAPSIPAAKAHVPPTQSPHASASETLAPIATTAPVATLPASAQPASSAHVTAPVLTVPSTITHPQPATTVSAQPARVPPIPPPTTIPALQVLPNGTQSRTPYVAPKSREVATHAEEVTHTTHQYAGVLQTPGHEQPESSYLTMQSVCEVGHDLVNRDEAYLVVGKCFDPFRLDWLESADLRLLDACILLGKLVRSEIASIAFIPRSGSDREMHFLREFSFVPDMIHHIRGARSAVQLAKHADQETDDFYAENPDYQPYYEYAVREYARDAANKQSVTTQDFTGSKAEQRDEKGSSVGSAHYVAVPEPAKKNAEPRELTGIDLLASLDKVAELMTAQSALSVEENQGGIWVRN